MLHSLISQKIDIQKLVVKLIRKDNIKLLRNIIDQSNIIKAVEQVTLIEQEKPKSEEDYEDPSNGWLG